MGEGMSKIQKLLKGVTTYPAIGSPRVVRIGNKAFWSGGVWASQTQIFYTPPVMTPDEANDEAKKLMNEMKKDGTK